MAVTWSKVLHADAILEDGLAIRKKTMTIFRLCYQWQVAFTAQVYGKELEKNLVILTRSNEKGLTNKISIPREVSPFSGHHQQNYLGIART